MAITHHCHRSRQALKDQQGFWQALKDQQGFWQALNKGDRVRDTLKEETLNKDKMNNKNNAKKDLGISSTSFCFAKRPARYLALNGQKKLAKSFFRIELDGKEDILNSIQVY